MSDGTTAVRSVSENSYGNGADVVVRPARRPAVDVPVADGFRDERLMRHPRITSVLNRYGRCLHAAGDGVLRRNFWKATGREVMTPSAHQATSLRQLDGASGSPSPNQFCQA